MTYLLRFTNNPTGDIERGTSYHYSDFTKGSFDWCDDVESEEDEINKVAEGFGCDPSDIEFLEEANCYVQSLGGLCCFELEAETIEEAIEEAKNVRSGSYSYETMSDIAYLFEGEIIDSCPEGAVMKNAKVVCKI